MARQYKRTSNALVQGYVLSCVPVHVLKVGKGRAGAVKVAREDLKAERYVLLRGLEHPAVQVGRAHDR